MEVILLGFFTGLSLILAIGPQNIFVIEQGLKKQHVFLLCIICSFSDFFLIFLGIFLFSYFNQFFNSKIEFILNIALILFLINFIFSKFKNFNKEIDLKSRKNDTKYGILLKTLGFTFLNHHVYSDTVFILGNFSKNYLLKEKIIFGIGASVASFLFFFLIGYLSNFFSKYAQNRKIWKIINLFIITFMSFLTFLVFLQIIN